MLKAYAVMSKDQRSLDHDLVAFFTNQNITCDSGT